MHAVNWQLPKASGDLLDEENTEENAQYFRSVSRHLENFGTIHHVQLMVDFHEALADLLKSDLALDNTGYVVGVGAYDDVLLSCDTKKVKLPWNEDEIDW